MRAWAHDRYTFPLPDGHRFPLAKYRLLRERLEREHVLVDICEPGVVSWDELGLVHSADWLERVRCGGLTVREERVMGLPWSPQLVNRARRAACGTLEAARDAVRLGVGMVLGGGTHHAGVSSARYCVFNDVAVTIAVLRAEGAIQRALVVDCDVHQGDGTAEIFGANAGVFTLSLHCERNYPFERIPSDLDVELPTGCGDAAYLSALGGALDEALAAFPAPDLGVYLAGADPWEGDRLGRLGLSKEGLRERDSLVLERLRSVSVPVCVTLAGGYAPDLAHTVDINTATVRVAAAHADRAAGFYT